VGNYKARASVPFLQENYVQTKARRQGEIILTTDNATDVQAPPHVRDSPARVGRNQEWRGIDRVSEITEIPICREKRGAIRTEFRPKTKKSDGPIAGTAGRGNSITPLPLRTIESTFSFSSLNLSSAQRAGTLRGF
jgi:hypothetical protein